MREAADKVETLLMTDIAHPTELIARGLLNDPLEHCHIVTTTTHKTLRRPRNNMIMIKKNYDNPLGLKSPKEIIRKISSILDSRVFPNTQNNPLKHVIASKTMTFQEALSEDYLEYIIQVKKNAESMAKEFIRLGYKIISDGTDNHLILIDLRSKDLTDKLAEETLIKADITINKNMIPFDDKSPFVTSKIRLNTPAVTTKGIDESDMTRMVNLIDKVLTHHSNTAVIAAVKKKVNK